MLKIEANQKLNSDEQVYVFLISALRSPETFLEIPKKSYSDSLSVNDRKRRNIPTLLNDQVNVFQNKNLTIFDSVTVNTNPITDNERSTKICR